MKKTFLAIALTAITAFAAANNGVADGIKPCDISTGAGCFTATKPCDQTTGAGCFTATTPCDQGTGAGCD